MKQYVCSICGYVYDEEKGIPDAGIGPNTRWEDLPDGWKCPWCGAGKGAFREKETEPKKEAEPKPASQEALETPDVMKELSAMEMSVICSNLSRGCEKQYQLEEAKSFQKLAEFSGAKRNRPSAHP